MCAGSVPFAIISTRHCSSAGQAVAESGSISPHGKSSESEKTASPEKGKGVTSRNMETIANGKQTTTHGLRLPQRVETLSEVVPTRKPSRKSTDLQHETIIAWVRIDWLSASI